MINDSKNNDIDDIDFNFKEEEIEELDEYTDDEYTDDEYTLDDDIIDVGDIDNAGDSLDDEIDDKKELDIEEDNIDDDDMNIMVKFNTNKHRMEGKHSLKRDTIFKGKIEDSSENSEYIIYQVGDFNSSDGLPIEVGSSYEFESRYHEDYRSRLNLSIDIYNLLTGKTQLDFSINRRKPNKQAFNDYYRMLLDNVGKEYTKSEIFVELSYYFTDNIFNMFKLLDKKYATQIIVELKKNGYLNNLNNINFI